MTALKKIVLISTAAAVTAVSFMGIVRFSRDIAQTASGELYGRSDISPRRYMKSKHSKITMKEKGSYYHYSYKFADHKRKLRYWTWTVPKRAIDKWNDRFGVPPSIFKPYRLVPSVIEERKRVISQGMFRRYGRYIGPDGNAMVNNYMPYMKAVHDKLEAVVQSEGLSKREKVMLLMTFCQDIPYGIPPREHKGKFINGIFPPVRSWNYEWGDCDTKAVMFSAILSHDPYFQNKIALVTVPGHMLCGLKIRAKPYDRHFTYQGSKYIYCEPVGPGHTPLGRPNKPYTKIVEVQPIKLWRTPPAITTTKKTTKTKDDDSQRVVSQTRMITYTYRFRVKVDDQLDSGKRVWFYTNSAGYRAMLYPVKFKNGYYNYSSDSRRVFAWSRVKRKGYLFPCNGNYIFTEINFPQVKENTATIDLALQKGKCIYVETKPNASIWAFKRNPKGRFRGFQYQADAEGKLRLILPPGTYSISSQKRLTRPFIDFDFNRGKGFVNLKR